VEEILRGQYLALVRQFLGPAIAVVLIDLIFLLLGLQDRNIGPDGSTIWLAVALAGITIFVMDLHALAWVGIWTGMNYLHTNRASGIAVARIMFLPWVAFILISTAVAVFELLTPSMSSRSNSLPLFHVVLWFGLSLANDLFFVAMARTKLRRQFREIVTQRFSARASRSIWRFFGKKSAPPPLPSPLAQ
jgi:hypothetical protein